MKFNSSRVAFGRHETFGLRYSWLPKGFQALSSNKKLFDSDGAIVELGVGKNMVASIRFWLRACQLITPQKPDELLPIGSLVFDEQVGLDPYLEDDQDDLQYISRPESEPIADPVVEPEVEPVPDEQSNLGHAGIPENHLEGTCPGHVAE